MGSQGIPIIPVIVDTEALVQEHGRRAKPYFHFEVGWVEEDQCAPIMDNAWRKEVDGAKVGEAIRCVAQELDDWCTNVLGDLEKCIKKVRKVLEECRRRDISREPMVSREEILKYKLSKLEDQKNLYWRQRAKVHWLRNGDHNTWFFRGVEGDVG